MLPKAFSSQILNENISVLSKDRNVRAELHRHFQTAQYAISYHLSQALPKGGLVCAYYPKSILAHLLPEAAKRRNCTVMSVHGTKEAVNALIAAGILNQTANKEDADICITEPDGFTPGGALMRPHEVKMLENIEVFGVGSALQWTKALPAKHDFVSISKTITELGIYTPEHFEKTVSRAFSWPALSIPSVI